ncbi:hypothetical protein JKA74_13650 [Marivirga sp. S37H4]|uniref:Uncharacterized protein n=1 Tax=Marivirga aurantiaca TaxID=2802615 RepID=A0A935CCJ4_9BACT|nr:hypothetical protein [Marivirga aurantiaca]MBK6266083.1 hypothetical protein [Marivirga aurantiaca]
MNYTKRSILTLVLTIGTAISTFGQTEIYNQIKTAISDSDIESLVSLAPKPEYGPTQFSTPTEKEISVQKKDLGNRISQHLDTFGKFEYTQLFADKVGHLPLVIGKLKGDEKTEYVMIGLADFYGEYRYVSFGFLDKLPSNMRGLDK